LTLVCQKAMAFQWVILGVTSLSLDPTIGQIKIIVVSWLINISSIEGWGVGWTRLVATTRVTCVPWVK
jgi:hypothetical protein